MAWSDNLNHIDIIFFNDEIHSKELNKDLKLDKDLDPVTGLAMKTIIKQYWDYFITEGAKQTILGYAFVINTGGPKPVCYCKPFYGHYESKVILEQVQQLIQNSGLNAARDLREVWWY